MAALRYKDEHNKVGYLLKPTGSDDYHQIIDFLRDSHIMYALTHNPIIFDSLVKQFWSTVTLRAPELGPPAILATIDKTPYTITEDLGMVSNIRNAKKFLLYPRFLQTILGIETKVTRQYKVLVFSSKLFANMRLNFTGQPMPLLPTMLLQAQAGKGEEVATQAVPQHMPAPNQPQAHLSLPPRQQTSDPQAHAPVLEHSQSSDPTTASFSRSHETDAGPFINVEDAPKVHSLETKLKDHKKLFKDVVGKLVKKVKALEVKLKTKKRKMVVSDSDQEDDDKQDVDLDTLRVLANAAVTVDSNIPSGGTSQIPAASLSVPTAGPPGASNVPPGTSVVPTSASTVPAGSPSVPADVPFSVAPAGVSRKGKYLMVEEGIHVKARTFKQMKEDTLGEEAAKRLYNKEQANLDRQRAELQCQRQEEVLDSAMYYTEADWLNIMDQVEANASLSKSLQGDDVSKDNFSAIMAALIKRKRQALAAKLGHERQNRPIIQAQQRAYMRQYVKNQSSASYNTGWTMAYVKSFNDDQLKQEFQKIHKVQSNSQIQAFSRTLKRSGPVLEEPSSKRQQSTETPISSVPEEVLPTPLGDINAFYRIDGSTKHFTTLRQILHMVDRQDLVNLYGLVVYYYENHPVAGAGLILWVKLMERMLMHKLEIDSDVVGNDMTTGFGCWLTTTQQMVFNSPCLTDKKELIHHEGKALSVAGSRFSDDYSMLLIFGIQCCWFEFKYVVPTGRVIVSTGRYVVLTGRVIVPTDRVAVNDDDEVGGVLGNSEENQSGEEDEGILVTSQN
uniref:JmjC domain-containing protein n=1 Tax=Tanacetum cinerariifolium TaxID=118510 RepID=A0A6L2N8R3_TANCI|nr:JmjC domain-containing protein [Tanacetum cinerariifolium]